MKHALIPVLIAFFVIGCAEKQKPTRVPGSKIYGDPRPTTAPKTGRTIRTEKSRTTVTPKTIVTEKATETATVRKARDGSRSLTISRTYLRREKPRRLITPYRTGTRPRVPLPPAPPVY